MITTLDHLERHIQSRRSSWSPTKIWSEIKIFVTILIVVFVVSSVTTNAQLYQEALQDVWGTVFVRAGGSSEANPSSLDTLATQTESVSPVEDQLSDEIQQHQLTAARQGYHEPKATDDMNSYLKQSLNSYAFALNTLPPQDRLVISSLGLNVPLLQSSFSKHLSDITKEDLDKDLYNGVVQYPTTPKAGQLGNMLVFGHTSYESRKQNPYATVFSKIPKLQLGQEVQVIQQGKQYTYRIIDKKIVKPSQVNDEYLRYTKGKYLTLLGCYPVGSDAKRIVVIGELVSK